MKPKIVLIMAFVYAMITFTNLLLFAQGVEIWNRTFSKGQARDITVDASGNTYVTGNAVVRTRFGNISIYTTIKYSSTGTLIEPFGNTDTDGDGLNDAATSFGDIASAIKIDSSGNIYVTGTGGNTGYFTVKYDSDGNQYGTASKPSTSFGNTDSDGDGRNDAAFFRISLGNALDMSIDSSGNIYVTGHGNIELRDFYITVKYDSAGRLIEPFGNTDMNGNGLNDATLADLGIDDIASAIAIDSTGKIYVVGRKHPGFSSSFDIALIKYNSDGTLAEPFGNREISDDRNRANGINDVAVFNSGLNDTPYDIAIDTNNNIYITGNRGDANFLTLKYNTTGNIVEPFGNTDIDGDGQNDAALFNRNFFSGAFAIAVDSSGNILVTGFSYNGTNHDYATIAYNSVGNTIEPFGNTDTDGDGQNDAAIFDSGFIDGAFGIAIDNNDNIYVTGQKLQEGVSSDYLTIRYSSAVTFNTPARRNVRVDLGSGVVVIFKEVTVAGNTTLTTSSTGPDPGDVYINLPTPVYYDINTTATYTQTDPDSVTIEIRYDDTGVPDETLLRIYKFVSGSPVNITKAPPPPNPNTAANRIVGESTSLSIFAVGIPKNLPPVANAGPDITVECSHHSGETILLDGSASTDPNGQEDIVKYEWFESFESGLVSIGQGITLQYTFGLGVHKVILQVTDKGGLSSTDEVIVSVVDTKPPTLTVTASPSILWPPNHKLIKIDFNISVFDACDPNPQVSLSSTASSEPDNGLGDGDRPNDIVIQNGVVYLRAERSGRGSGRVYTIGFRAVDSSGNEAIAYTEVKVPHDMSR